MRCAQRRKPENGKAYNGDERGILKQPRPCLFTCTARGRLSRSLRFLRRPLPGGFEKADARWLPCRLRCICAERNGESGERAFLREKSFGTSCLKESVGNLLFQDVRVKRNLGPHLNQIVDGLELSGKKKPFFVSHSETHNLRVTRHPCDAPVLSSSVLLY